MTESIYSEFIQAKDGSSIPQLKSGRTLESKYNPQRDADIIINSLEENYSFFIVVGIGSGILIKRLLETFSCKIIGVELSNIDINFLKSNQATKEILENPDLILANKDNLKQIINQNTETFNKEFEKFSENSKIFKETQKLKDFGLEAKNKKIGSNLELNLGMNLFFGII